MLMQQTVEDCMLVWHASFLRGMSPIQVEKKILLIIVEMGMPYR